MNMVFFGVINRAHFRCCRFGLVEFGVMNMGCFRSYEQGSFFELLNSEFWTVDIFGVSNRGHFRSCRIWSYERGHFGDGYVRFWSLNFIRHSIFLSVFDTIFKDDAFQEILKVIQRILCVKQESASRLCNWRLDTMINLWFTEISFRFVGTSDIRTSL